MAAQDEWVENRRHVHGYGGVSIHVPRGVLQQLERVCVVCGRCEERVLHIDHINGNPEDNRLENLQVLCVWCHEKKTDENSPYKGLLKWRVKQAGEPTEVPARGKEPPAVPARKEAPRLAVYLGSQQWGAWESAVALVSSYLGEKVMDRIKPGEVEELYKDLQRDGIAWMERRRCGRLLRRCYERAEEEGLVSSSQGPRIKVPPVWCDP